MDDTTIVKRPKPEEGEDELFRMQEEFLKSRQQPSAKVINLRKQHKQINDSNSKLSECGKSGLKFRSKFAERRANKEGEKCVSTSQSDGDVINPDISEDVLLDKFKVDTLPDVLQNIPENPSRIILGNIMEKKYDRYGTQLIKKPNDVSSDTGFPKAFVLDREEFASSSESLFQQSILQREQKLQSCSMSIDNHSGKVPSDKGSLLIEGPLASEIHETNMEKLAQMTHEEILKEKACLERTLDPDIIKFLKAKKNTEKQSTIPVNLVELNSDKSRVKTDECKLQSNVNTQPHISMDCSSSSKTTDNVILTCGTELKMECDGTTMELLPLPVTEIVDQANEKGWIHMDEVESTKLEWMKDIPGDKNDEPQPDEPYNARFDFNGTLLPFKDENLTIDQGLHHHGEEPERPGYTLQELLQLSRSSTQQQRITALTTLGNIMDKSKKGWYDKALDPPPLVALNQRNILLLLRISLDDTSVAVVTATLQSLRSFLYTEADEVCLDRLCGWDYPDGSCLVPDLLPPKTDVNDTSELKDHELVQLDCVAAAMRSDIVLRIRYILDEMRPLPVAVTFALEILIRLARHSRITALNISSTPRLLEIIVTNFIPLTPKSHEARNDAQNAYGVPNVTALRLCRVLVEYAGRPVTDRLNNLKIVHLILSYISSNTREMDLKLSIEALRLWRLLLIHGVALDSLGDAKLILNSQLQLLLSNHDLTSASELSCEYASALINVSSHEPILKPFISTLLTKWSTQLEHVTSATWSNTKLVAVTLKALGDISALKTKWIFNANLFVNICSTSNLLCGFVAAAGRDPTSLPSLGALSHNGQLQPAIGLNSCIPFLATLCNEFAKASMRNELATMFLNADIIKYFRRLVNSHWSLESSWYTRAELFLVTAMVRVAEEINTNDLMKELLLKIAIKIIPTLPSDAVQSVKEVLGIVLSNDRLTVERLSSDLNALKLDCGDQKISLTLPNDIIRIFERYFSEKGNWNEFALPQDWPYLPLVAAYSNYKNTMKWNEDDTMKIIISLSLEMAMPEIYHGLMPSLRFTRIILVYLCETIYLNSNISVLLNVVFTNLVKKYYKRLDFSTVLPGLTSFTDLFTCMCESFYANSYGHEGFAAALLVPIAQRYDNHYRKLLWSEHAAALRYLRLSPEKMIIPMREYLYPIEEDVSLIQCYITALIRGDVNEKWCPVMNLIAIHHSAIFLRGTSKLATKMRSSVASLPTTHLVESILNYVSTYE